MSRALILLVLVVLAPLLAVQAGMYGQWFRAQMEEERQANLEVAGGVAAAFEALVRDVRRQELALGRALAILEPDSAEQGNRLLAACAGEYPSIRSWRWVSPDGRIVASSDPKAIGVEVGDRDYFVRTRSGRPWAVTDLLTDRATGRRMLILARRIDDDAGRLAGVMTAAIEPAGLGELALRIPRTQGGGFTIFDRTGHAVYSSLPPDQAHLKWMADDPMLRAALAGRQQTGDFACSADGKRHIAAHVPMSALDPNAAQPPFWVAVASRPEAAAMAGVYAGLWTVALANVAVVVLSLLGVVFLARSITSPLRTLRQHAQAIGRGELERRTAIRSVRELGELAEGLNGMAEDLQAARRQERQARADLESANARLHEVAEERHRTAEALRHLTEDLRRSNQDLEQFAYVASHDLQEPLRAITGHAQLLERRFKDTLGPDADQYIGFIVEGAGRMQQLINDLLNYSRVGSRGQSPAPVDMEAVLRRTEAALRRAIEESRAVITHDPLPAVQADETLMFQLLQNLISNAIKFRGEAPPAIHISARNDDGKWVFAVRDNGVGIDPKHWDRIFVIFQRLHGRGQYPGTGIGLAICKKIVERHGGRIWLESQPGKGSTFYFRI